MNSSKNSHINFLISTPSIELWKIHIIEKVLSLKEFQIKIFYIGNAESIKNYRLKGKKGMYLFYDLLTSLESKLFKSSHHLFDSQQIFDRKTFQNIIMKCDLYTLRKALKSDQNAININLTDIPFSQTLKKFKVDDVWSIFTGNSEFNHKFSGLEEFVCQHEIFKISIGRFENEKFETESEYNISSSFSRVDKLSLCKTKSFAYAKLPNMFEKIIKNGFSQMNKTCSDSTFSNNSHTFLNYIFRLIAIYLKRIKAKLSNYLYFDQWILLYNLENGQTGIDSLNVQKLKEILPPKDRIWADPFIIEKEGVYHVFIEELINNQGKGFISHFTIDSNGYMTKPQKIIEENYHMSYPYIFEDNGTFYMLPETNRNKTISLYRCINFPLEWEFEMHLIEHIDANDSSILFRDDKYWIFTNVRTNKFMSCDDELYVFYSDELKSNNWTPHTLNPVVSDVRTSRPAGKIIFDKTSFLRPVQNCSKHYGYGLNFLKVIKLNPSEFKETLIKSIVPNWDKKLKSVHTYSQVNSLTIMDAQKKRFRYW